MIGDIHIPASALLQALQIASRDGERDVVLRAREDDRTRTLRVESACGTARVELESALTVPLDLRLRVTARDVQRLAADAETRTGHPDDRVGYMIERGRLWRRADDGARFEIPVAPDSTNT